MTAVIAEGVDNYPSVSRSLALHVSFTGVDRLVMAGTIKSISSAYSAWMSPFVQ